MEILLFVYYWNGLLSIRNFRSPLDWGTPCFSKRRWNISFPNRLIEELPLNNSSYHLFSLLFRAQSGKHRTLEYKITFLKSYIFTVNWFLSSYLTLPRPQLAYYSAWRVKTSTCCPSMRRWQWVIHNGTLKSWSSVN